MTTPEPPAPMEGARSFNVPGVYFNGFQLMLSNADISLLCLLDNEPALKANMSYTTAKTLLVKLGTLVETLEKSTGRDIMTTEDAGKGLESISLEAGRASDE